jgi:hypothetical protein
MDNRASILSRGNEGIIFLFVAGPHSASYSVGIVGSFSGGRVEGT